MSGAHTRHMHGTVRAAWEEGGEVHAEWEEEGGEVRAAWEEGGEVERVGAGVYCRLVECGMGGGAFMGVGL